jgi:hypothetical protein
MQFVRHRHGAYTSQQPPLFLQGSSDNPSDAASSGIGTRRLKNDPKAKKPKQQHASAKDLATQIQSRDVRPPPFLVARRRDKEFDGVVSVPRRPLPLACIPSPLPLFPSSAEAVVEAAGFLGPGDQLDEVWPSVVACSNTSHRVVDRVRVILFTSPELRPVPPSLFSLHRMAIVGDSCGGHSTFPTAARASGRTSQCQYLGAGGRRSPACTIQHYLSVQQPAWILEST